MNKIQKTFMHNWARSKKFTIARGGKISLEDIIDDLHRTNNPTDEGLPVLLENIHPYFVFNFIIDWNRVPDHKLPTQYKTGEEFGRDIVQSWQKECWKNKFFNFDILSNYDTIDQLREATSHVLSDNLLYYNDDGKCDYNSLVERLYAMRQTFLDEEARKTKEEMELLEVERQIAASNQQQREAQFKADELRRKKASLENKVQARQNREFSAKKDSPWTSTVKVEDLPIAPITNSGATTAFPEADTDSSAINPGSFLLQLDLAVIPTIISTLQDIELTKLLEKSSAICSEIEKQIQERNAMAEREKKRKEIAEMMAKLEADLAEARRRYESLN